MTTAAFNEMKRRSEMSIERGAARSRFLNQTAKQINAPQVGEIDIHEPCDAARKLIAQNSPGLKEWKPTLTQQQKNFLFSITINGQIKGGKNNMVVTRTGRHFPKPEWAKWRDYAVGQVKAQLPPDWKPISVPQNIRLEYVAGDKRRRDMPAVVDSIFHVFEKAGVVEDDTLLWVAGSSRSYDKETPCAIITFL